MADPGEGPGGGGPGPLLFLDQTEARRVDPASPPPVSQVLDPALTCQAIASNSRIVYVIGHCMAAIITPFVDLNDFF